MKDQLKKTLLGCLREGGRIIRKGYGRSHRIRKKSPVSLVTEIDLEADHKVRALVRKNFPDHQFLTEELKAVENDSPYRWIIDPLDGTTNFAHEIPFCCISIGLEFNKDIILGGVYNPILEELFFAEKGKGSTLNGRKIRVSKAKNLIDSLLVTGFPYDRQEKAGFYVKFFQAFLEKCQGVRRLGAAAMDLAYVACGRFEAYWEFNLKPWDMAAGMLIVQEAGGQVTDFHGSPIDVSHPYQILSSNGRIHSTLLKIFKKTL